MHYRRKPVYDEDRAAHNAVAIGNVHRDDVLAQAARTGLPLMRIIMLAERS